MRKVLQHFCSGRWGPMSLQLAPESQQDQRQAHVLVTTGMNPAFNFNNEQQQIYEERMYAAAEEQQWRAAQELKLVEEQGLHFPPMVSQHLWMFLQKRIISIAHKMLVGINLIAVQHL